MASMIELGRAGLARGIHVLILDTMFIDIAGGRCTFPIKKFEIHVL
jgi:hypothetical protein